MAARSIPETAAPANIAAKYPGTGSSRRRCPIRSLGTGETGSRVAAPIFREFMRQALAETPAIPFRVPRGIRFVRIDIETGMVAREGDKNVLVEAFRIGTEPSPLSRQAGNQSNPDGIPILTEGSGGLY